MSWHYLPELVAESSVASCSAGVPSGRSRSTHTAGRCCYGDKQTACSPCSRSGTTSAPSTADPGVERWISSLRDSRANRSRLPENVRHNWMTVTSGRIPFASLAKSGRNLYFSKTYPGYFPELMDTSEPYSETWPQSGLMLDGECYRLPTLVPATSGNDYGYLPTPRASDGEKGGPNQQTKGKPALAAIAAMLSTPTVNDSRGGRNQTARRQKDGNHHSGTTLTDYITQWPTPCASDHKNRLTSKRESHLQKTVGGKLNPAWVEWLMGWPIGWTGLGPLATDKYQQWLQQHGGV